MTLAEVQGQPRAVETLRSALRTGAIHHAWLFAGPEGVGKELTAAAFAQALTCPVKPNEGCGECASCRRIAHRNHPDVLWLMPEAEQVSRGLAGRSDFTGTPSREIKVEQIRSLLERLSLRGLESDRKVAIVASAQEMNDKAQNAFLKTLEEPRPGTTLILISSAPDSLLGTIRSRCSRLNFGPLPKDFIAQRLQQERKLDPATASLVAVMAGGSLSRALEMDLEGLAHRKEIIAQFEEISFDKVGSMLGFAEVFSASRDDAEHALRILDVWTRDLAVLRAGGDVSALANADLADLAHRGAGKVNDVELHQRHKLIESAKYAITERNGSARLQLERMLLEMGRASGRLR